MTRQIKHKRFKRSRRYKKSGYFEAGSCKKKKYEAGMFSVETIKDMNRKAGGTAMSKGLKPLIYDGNPETLRKIPNIGDHIPKGWEKVDSYFVDSSGLGRAGEGALTFGEFVRQAKVGMGYAITSAGQFQVYISEYKKVAVKKSSSAGEYKLKPKYDGRVSFYGKAVVRQEGNRKILMSYNTDVAYIENGKAVINGEYSETTTRHVKEFLKQNGFKVESTKQIMEDYGRGE